MNTIEIARKNLIQIAKSKGTISYSSLADKCGLNPHRGGGKPMADILDEISKEEFGKNRNMLFALIRGCQAMASLTLREP